MLKNEWFCLDQGTTGNQSIFYYSHDAALDKVSVILSCCFLNIVAVNDLKQPKNLFSSMNLSSIDECDNSNTVRTKN